MVDPGQVDPILNDAARLVREGEIVVFGSAALALWLRDAPRTRDVDVWCDPPEKGDVIVALMGEQSWYHRTHGAYVEVWAPETFAAPEGWRNRARIVTHRDLPEVRLVIPHPHDVILSKLERFEAKDREHFDRVLEEFPLTSAELERLAATCPQRRADAPAERSKRFEHGFAAARARIESVR